VKKRGRLRHAFSEFESSATNALLSPDVLMIDCLDKLPSAFTLLKLLAVALADRIGDGDLPLAFGDRALVDCGVHRLALWLAAPAHEAQCEIPLPHIAPLGANDAGWVSTEIG
jgi:hypothetical protein